MKIRIGILLVVMAVFAVPSFAQRFFQEREITGEDGGWSGESSYSSGQYLDNPCTAVSDLVWVNYAAYVQGAQEAAGVDRYFFNENTNVGGMYAASGSAETDVAYAQPLAIRNYYKVNTADNFHVVTVVNFDPAAQYTWVTVETACGNGMPDSQE